MGKFILRVNMSDLSVKKEDVPEKYRLLGGRVLTSTVVADEVNPACHPLGPNNKIVFAPGIVTGTNAPSSGRLSVGAKSPLTGTIKEANAGGIPAQKLARLGIHALIVEGEPKEKGKFFVLKLAQDTAILEEAGELAGKGMYDSNEIIWKKYGEGVGVIGIGPAGEMLMCNAGVSCNDPENGPGRYAGRGGLGAVMGSKGLKAIIIDQKGTGDVVIANRDLFKQGQQKLAKALQEHAVTGQALPAYGTAVLVNILNEAGGLPTRNFSSGRFEGAGKISGEVINEWSKTRGGKVGHACHPGCVIKCSNVVTNPDGSYHCSPVEYETAWSLGANCGIDNMDDVAEMNRICNDVGLDTIEAGATLGVAMEAGILSFGDGKKAIELLKEVGQGTPMGRIIGNGAAFTGRAMGVTRVPVVKGQAMPAYDPRAVKGIGVTYATSTMGADHTAGYTVATEILSVGGKADPLDAAEKGALAKGFQSATIFIDSAGYCLFIAFAILDIPEGFQGMLDTVNGVLGTEYTADDFNRLGAEWLAVERKFNEAAGFTNKDDRLPEFMYYEKLPPHNQVFDVDDEVLDSVHS
ncbi:MAG: aldehyde ferredoxin oxidoreductase [Firmicutes bacterium HGW-Firmicutes-14]|nr:MAG: aldehyde ferredoxin oxidoreductase [Firmicutes bacterium HGW-Firmicutes-14]